MASRTGPSTSDRPLTPRLKTPAVEYVSDWQLFPQDPYEETYPLADAETEVHDVTEQVAAT